MEITETLIDGERFRETISTTSELALLRQIARKVIEAYESDDLYVDGIYGAARLSEAEALAKRWIELYSRDEPSDESQPPVTISPDIHKVDEHVQRLAQPKRGDFRIDIVTTTWSHGRAELERKSVVQIGEDQFRVWQKEEQYDAKGGYAVTLHLVPQSDWPVAFPELYPPFSDQYM